MRKIVQSAIFLFIFGLFSSLSHADERVDVELVLAIDVSASVTEEEYFLQVEGLSSAFRDPKVIAAIDSAGPNGIAVAVVQWSGQDEQSVTVGWAHLASVQSIAGFAAKISGMSRRFHGGYTYISEAMYYSSLLFYKNGFSSNRRIIDVSGDGGLEIHGRTKATRDTLVGLGFIINGLAIETDVVNLTNFYIENVMGGFGSFVVTATDYVDFRRAIRRKLVREISPLRISGHFSDKP